MFLSERKIGSNRKKNILIINSASEISGAENSLINFLEYCHDHKYNIYIILPSSGALYNKLVGKYYIKVYKLRRFKKSTAPIYLIGVFFITLFYSIKILQFAKSKKIDIIYSNTTQANIYTILAKIFTKKKIVWHVRDNVANKFINKALSQYSDKIVCVSEFINKQIHAPSSKKVVIYNGVNIAEWTTIPFTQTSLRGDLNIGEDIRLISQIGQLVPWKNHEDFIMAAKLIINEYDKAHFLIVGSDLFGTEKNYILSLKRMIEKEGLNNYITFIGYIEDIKEFIKQIDVLIHPALNEPFGRVLIETMAMGKPVIAYKSGGPCEIIQHEIDGFLIEPGNYSGIAAKCIELLKDQQFCEKIGKNARERVISKFNMQDTIIELETVFDKLS